MLAESLRTSYQHSHWATARLLDAADGLTPEQLHAPGSAGRGSVRDTLVHMLSAHRGWLAWWDGSLPPEEAYALSLDANDHPDVAAIRATWETVEADTRAFVDGLTDADAARIYTMSTPGGDISLALWQMMLHIAHHNTQHRSEVAAMLTGFGQSPGDLDMLFFLLDPSAGGAG